MFKAVVPQLCRLKREEAKANTTSRLKRRTDPKGQYRDTTYFKDNTIQQISYPNASPSTASVNFTYDTVYNRVATMVDGTGTTSYAYYPVTTGGTLGATELATVDGPLSNDTISYSYDELGRLLGRSINGVAATQTYDELGRTPSVTNVLGTFNTTYVNQTSRVQSVSYPNGKTTGYSYFPNSGDRRLQQILNQKTGSITISKFNYPYDVVGNSRTWTQQTDSDPAKAYDLAYDRTDQLSGAVWRTTDPTATILKRYGYAYDSAGNRTAEQIDDVPLKASYNNMNRLLAQDPGGITRFAGTLSEAAKVTIQSKPATVTADNKFSGTATLAGGTNSVDVQATDYSGNTRTSTYQVTVSGTTKSFTHDPNGNMTGDGTRTFDWDAENRLTAVNNGSHRSEFSYDGLGRRIRIVEKDNSVVTTDTRFLWCGEEICEERDSTGATSTKRFFPQGEQQGVDNYFYTRDHLGSIRELIDSTGSIRARYDYDPHGRRSKISGNLDTDLAYSGHRTHAANGLVLTLYRVYDPNLGRWLSEDPLSFKGDTDFYTYVLNDPVNRIDPFGLKTTVIVLYDRMIGGITYGSHAALLIDNGGDAILYDPAGAYAPAHRCGSGDTCGQGDADIDKYRKYHEQNGSTLQLFVFHTTLSEEEQIADRIEQIGGAAPFLCASSVSSAIKGIGPFKNLKGSPFPGWLAKQLQALPRPSHSVSGAW